MHYEKTQGTAEPERDATTDQQSQGIATADGTLDATSMNTHARDVEVVSPGEGSDQSNCQQSSSPKLSQSLSLDNRIHPADNDMSCVEPQEGPQPIFRDVKFILTSAQRTNLKGRLGNYGGVFKNEIFRLLEFQQIILQQTH